MITSLIKDANAKTNGAINTDNKRFLDEAMRIDLIDNRIIVTESTIKNDLKYMVNVFISSSEKSRFKEERSGIIKL